MFDSAKSGKIETEKVRTILITIMGHNFDDEQLEALLEEELARDHSGKLNFDSFCRVAGHFLVEEDDEAMLQELKEAFRLYDKEGNIPHVPVPVPIQSIQFNSIHNFFYSNESFQMIR